MGPRSRVQDHDASGRMRGDSRPPPRQPPLTGRVPAAISGARRASSFPTTCTTRCSPYGDRAPREPPAAARGETRSFPARNCTLSLERYGSSLTDSPGSGSWRVNDTSATPLSLARTSCISGPSPTRRRFSASRCFVMRTPGRRSAASSTSAQDRGPSLLPCWIREPGRSPRATEARRRSPLPGALRRSAAASLQPGNGMP